MISIPAPPALGPSLGRGFLLAFVLVTVVFGKPIVNGDGVQYYAYARSPVVDRDIDFTNEYAEGLPRFKASVPLAETTSRGLQNAYAPVGAAVVWTPVIAATHLAMVMLNRAGAPVAADGYSDPYMVAVALTSWLMMLVGLFLCHELARRWFAPRAALFAVVGGWLASPLFANAYELPTFVHAVDFGLVSLLVYLVVTFAERASATGWFFIGLALGSVIQVRQQNVSFALIPAAYWLRLWITRQPLAAGDAWRSAAAMLAGAAIGYLPQMALNVGLHGSPLVWPSKYVRLDWPPHLWRDLFSWDQGLFSWTPAMLPAVLGLISGLRDSRRRLLAALGCGVLLMNVLLIGSLSYGPVLIGQRYLINCVPFLILGLGAVFEAIGADGRRANAAVAAALLAFFVMWNINLETLAVFGGIDRRGPITLLELARHEVMTAPRYWIRHLQGESVSRSCFSIVHSIWLGIQGHELILAKGVTALAGTVLGTWATARVVKQLVASVPAGRWQPAAVVAGTVCTAAPIVIAGFWLWLGRLSGGSS